MTDKPKNLLEDYDALGTKPFKLKDKVGRRVQIIPLKNEFGKMPEIIAVEKYPGANNTFLVRAFFPKKKKKTKEVTEEKKTE